jgi:hypothetical protein
MPVKQVARARLFRCGFFRSELRQTLAGGALRLGGVPHILRRVRRRISTTFEKEVAGQPARGRVCIDIFFRVDQA